MKFLYYFGKTLVERNVAGSRLVSIMEASGVAWLAGLTSTYLAVLLLAPFDRLGRRSRHEEVV
jgi:hypothetical protein